MSREEQVPGRPDRALAGEAAEAAGSAAEAMSRGGGEPPAPGDLYALPATAAYDVEWLLSAVDPETADPASPTRWRAVATDTGPWVGSGDVEMAEDPAIGPLVARCHHRHWISAPHLAAGRRTGRVKAETVARVEERCRRLDDGALDASPLERETDEDPDYGERHQELLQAGRALTATAAADTAGTGPAPRGEHASWRRNPWAWATAAVLLAAVTTVGLLIAGHQRQVQRLEARVARMEAPIVTPAGEPFLVGIVERGPDDPLTPTTSGGLHYLRLNFPPTEARYRLEIAGRDGGPSLITFPVVEMADDQDYDVILHWSAERLPPGLYDLRVTDLGSRPAEVLETASLLVSDDPDADDPVAAD